MGVSFSHVLIGHHTISVTAHTDADDEYVDGFVQENDYQLSYTLPLGDRTVRALLRHVNAYRQRPIRHVCASRGAPALSPSSALADGDVVWVVVPPRPPEERV